MCGIVGYVGRREAVGLLLDGLKRLEYRGYDSSGIAVFSGGRVEIVRAVGKIHELESLLFKKRLSGNTGIGHTRWATHGKPTEKNAHPHAVSNVILVHNGIIENFAALKKKLEKSGASFRSETDTEVICHLIHNYYQKTKCMEEAIRRALLNIDGSYAILVMDASNPGVLYAARKFSPLIIGIGNDEMWVASDIPAILPHTRKVVVMEDDELAVITKRGFKLFDIEGREIKRKHTLINWDPIQAEKGGFKHFMLKEIFEQPRALRDTLAGRVTPSDSVVPDELRPLLDKNSKLDIERVCIIGCGTSYHAALAGKYWMERIGGLPTTVELGSEFRNREPIVSKKTLVIAISQSGETADTVGAARLAKDKGAKVASICNVVGSSLSRISNAVFYTHAGPEIGVASTKAFTAQLAALLLMAVFVGKRRRFISSDIEMKVISELKSVPEAIEKILGAHEHIKTIAEKYIDSERFIFIGRGLDFPIALEGALKLKEISYVHAEGFAGGELKHGPIALIDTGVPVVSVISGGNLKGKMISNMEEVKARGAKLIAVAADDVKDINRIVDDIISIPCREPLVFPITSVVPLQLFAYYIADYKGTDIDQPRNLAKSVTVE